MLWVSLSLSALLCQLDSSSVLTTDFADAANRELWMQHPVWGEPSFDSFKRLPGNPVHRGTPPYAWPVNGFLFEDPPTGHWYLYVGNYLDGYKLNDEHPSICTAFRSTDEGAHWEELGSIMEVGAHVYDGEVSPVFHAPDVSVVYSDGLYHLCFDWTTRNTTWENAATPDPDSNNGVGYAWATRPEGPFTITRQPLATTRSQTPLLGKYRRLYASSLIRRAEDWLVLTLTDSGPYFGWALLGMTSDEAAGPYTAPLLLLHPETDRYHPPLLEFFPAFTHGDYVYMPATSVALNRNFQCLFRAPIEEAHRPGAWTLHQHGSLWHAEPVEHEAHGLWGQAFSGFVDAKGVLNVMFPSRDANGLGTINLASRPWSQPFRDRGFVVSGHRGPSLARTRHGGIPDGIEVHLKRKGAFALAWDMTGPMGADAPRSDASIHPGVRSSCSMLEFTETQWRMLYLDANWHENQIASGALGPPRDAMTIALDWKDGQCVFSLDGMQIWQGAASAGKGGGFGMWASSFSVLEVSAFNVAGKLQPVPATLLYTEALLGAAQGFVHWVRVESPLFRHGEGAVSRSGAEQARAKWNFQGRSAVLWAPRGPEFGSAEVFLDGKLVARLDFHAAEPEVSAPVLNLDDLPDGYHALLLAPLNGGSLPLDCLEALQ